MTKDELEMLMDRSAAAALDARSRIEALVDSGLAPVWVLEACNDWERAAMVYGAARARLREQTEPQRYGMEDLPLSLLRPGTMFISHGGGNAKN